MNIELETPQRPRLSVKVGYYFNGIERPNMGNTCAHGTSTLHFHPSSSLVSRVCPRVAQVRLSRRATTLGGA